MVEFTLWDIFRNLLLAARWTVVLSLIAFVGGGLRAGARGLEEPLRRDPQERAPLDERPSRKLRF